MSRRLAVAAFVAVSAVVALITGCATTPTPRSGLDGTRWQLEVLTSMADEVPPARATGGRPYTLSFDADGTLRLQLDCNRGRATWQAEAAPDATAQRSSGSLRLGPLTTTRAACAPGSIEPRLMRELPFVRSFVIEGGRLHLALMADGGIQTWAPLGATAP